MNELLFLVTIALYFTAVLVMERFFGKAGVYVWVALATVLMNLELPKLVVGFGLEMYLGNAFFASTFLCTDILNEKYGKKAARKGATIGALSVVVYLVATQFALAFVPSPSDWAAGMMAELFGIVPRVTLASVSVFLLVQFHDVFLYQ